MCLSPRMLPTGVIIPCQECVQCRLNAINDWVGRNIAEAKTSVASHCIDLTYGRGEAGEVLHERALLLTYSDVQLYLKRWRAEGYKLRYFATGEFGSFKGRAHWHLIVHWQDKVPEFELDKRVNEPHWEHGFSWVRPPTIENIRYNCKYIQKGMGPRDGFKIIEPPRMSKYPPLGAEYFRRLALTYVKQGMAPQDLRYTFPGIRRKDKKTGEEVPVYFVLRERSAELFLQAYLDAWRSEHGRAEYPHSDLLRLFESYGRIVYDEANVGKVYNPRDYGRRPVELDTGKAVRAAEAEADAKSLEESLRQSRYWNHQFRWRDDTDVERELDRRGVGRRG